MSDVTLQQQLKLSEKGFAGLILMNTDNDYYYFTDYVLFDVKVNKQTNSILYREKGFDEWNEAE